MSSPSELVSLLRRAEPEYASGTFVERSNEAVHAVSVFAYRRGGAWALLNSRQGLRLSDAHSLWSAGRGHTRIQFESPPGYHSGALRDMLIPRYRSLVQRGQQDRLGPTVEPCSLLGREALCVQVLGEARFPEWQMYVDAEMGVVLADRVVDDDGCPFERTFLALDLGTRLPDELFTWEALPDSGNRRYP